MPGAAPTSPTWKRLPEEFPALRIIKLEQNYRSTVRILKAANAVIAHNEKLFEKTLWSELGHGEPISVTACRDNEAEAEAVVMKLRPTASRTADASATTPSLPLQPSGESPEQALRNAKIPTSLSGGQSFFDKDRDQGPDQLPAPFANEDDDPAFIRAATTPKRGIGATTLQALGPVRRRAPRFGFAAVVRGGFRPTIQGERLESLLTFCQFISRFQHRAAASRPRTWCLISSRPSITKPTCMTTKMSAPRKTAGQRPGIRRLAHQEGREEGKTLLDLTSEHCPHQHAGQTGNPMWMPSSSPPCTPPKVSEYPTCSLTGVEEGILPTGNQWIAARSTRRRLMYVGITRAQRSLHVSYCERRKQAAS